MTAFAVAVFAEGEIQRGERHYFDERETLWGKELHRTWREN